jgi:ABC-type histidine transport system ATPase subunit
MNYRAGNASASRWRVPGQQTIHPSRHEPTGTLIPKRAGDHGFFEELSQKGHTIIVVTHEEDVARHAGASCAFATD